MSSIPVPTAVIFGSIIANNAGEYKQKRSECAAHTAKHRFKTSKSQGI